MGTLIQRVVRWLRDFGETWTLRVLQWVSVQLGRFTPRVQTRIVRAVQVAVEVHVKSLVDDVSTQAAALTYAAFLSLLPLLLVGFSLAGTVITSVGETEWFQELIAGIPGLAEAGLDTLGDQLRSRADVGVVGLIGALWAASVLSSRAERALSTIFGVKRRNVVNRFRAVMITVVLGAVVIGGVVVGAVVQSFDLHGLIAIPAWFVVRGLLALIEFGYFLLLYKLLTPSRTLRWRDHLPGAIVMTLGFGALKIVGGLVVARTVAHWSSLYGVIGGIFGLLVIIRLAMWIFLYGAELSSVLTREQRGDPGVPQMPQVV
jgi:membrane protein